MHIETSDIYIYHPLVQRLRIKIELKEKKEDDSASCTDCDFIPDSMPGNRR